MAELAKDVSGLSLSVQQALDNGDVDVPLLPSVAAEVLSSSLDDRSNATRFAELIQQDQSMTSHLMRVVNSPVFRGASEIVALQQAIARLGMERIREIALTVSLKASVLQPGPYDDLMSRSWYVALRSALWAREISRLTRKNVEVAYLCGLLHNIGEPLVLNCLGKMTESASPDEVAQVLRNCSRQAGLLLVQEWALPSAVDLAIRFRGEFESAANAKDLVAIVDLARFISCLKELPICEQVVDQAETQHLNLYPDEVDALLEQGENIATTLETLT
ncbi:MAG: HDOD domain-containing protein [Pseudomonadota bacterium]